MARKQKSSFLNQHYDKLLVAGALVFLGVSLAAYLSQSSSASEEKAKFDAQLRNQRPLHPRAPARSDGLFFLVADKIDNPYRFAGEGTFLVPPERVYCYKCSKPILPDADVCPWPDCKEPQPTGEVPEDYDSDGDGLPDKWETAHNLNPYDAADADVDTDGDGFTNREEFEQKTDPNDPASHPARFEFFAISDITVIPFPYTVESGTSLSWNFRPRKGVRVPGVKSDQQIPVRKKDKVRGTDWVVTDAKKISKEEVVQGIAKPRKVERWVLTLVRTDKDGKTDTIQLEERDQREVPADSQASFYCAKDPEKTVYTVKRDESFEFDGETFTLQSVDRIRNKAVLVRKSNGEKMTVSKE